MVTQIGMEGVLRCPDCHLAPEWKIVKNFEKTGEQFQFGCERHGHYATGETFELAATHWNIYVKFTEGLRKSA